MFFKYRPESASSQEGGKKPFRPLSATQKKHSDLHMDNVSGKNGSHEGYQKRKFFASKSIDYSSSDDVPQRDDLNKSKNMVTNEKRSMELDDGKGKKIVQDKESAIKLDENVEDETKMDFLKSSRAKESNTKPGKKGKRKKEGGNYGDKNDEASINSILETPSDEKEKKLYLDKVDEDNREMNRSTKLADDTKKKKIAKKDDKKDSLVDENDDDATEKQEEEEERDSDEDSSSESESESELFSVSSENSDDSEIESKTSSDGEEDEIERVPKDTSKKEVGLN